MRLELDIIFGSLLNILTSWHLMGLIFLAIPIGLFFGAVPGLGGKLGIVLLIPFVFGMDPIAGSVFLLAMHAVVHTGGSIPAILFGVPGTGPDAATIVDGYPMAQRGEAARALGASLGASGIGGIIGALFLALMLPVIKPVVLAFSPAEFFLLAIFGITFIAMLSGRSLIKGVAVGLLGILVSLVGLDPHTGAQRFTFDQLFLCDGVSVIVAVLGIFAIPEMISLGVKGGTISEVKQKAGNYNIREVIKGALEPFAHLGLTIRTSIMGAIIGAIPGLGGDAASWICYGHAVQSAKDPENFGKGDVRGIIAPETANNSKEGGSLIPTLFFGVPGSSGMAILLGAFVMLGIQPGPQMALTGMNIVWSLIWALALANFLSIFVFIALAPAFSLLSYVRGALLIPFVLLLAFLGAFLAENAWENIILLTVMGILGYFLKKFGWPRPPFVIGLVLGGIAEGSIFKALAIWGPTFFLRPMSLVLIAMIVLTVLFYILRARKNKHEVDYDL